MTATRDYYANNVKTTVAGGASGAGTTFLSSDLTFQVPSADASKFPPLGPFICLAGSMTSTYEFLKCTGRSGNIITVTRAAEDGTSHPAQNWTTGTTIEVVVTAGEISNLWDAINRGRVYNVLDYGAKGDGVTDDAGPIQNCINDSLAGSRIYFPYTGNKYVVGTMIKFKSGRAYYGDQDETWLQMKNSANLAAIACTEEWANDVTLAGNPMFISDLGFDGNDANNTSGHGFVLQAWQSVMRQCWIKHTPQTAVVMADRTYTGMILAGGPTYNVTNSIVENKLYDLKIANTGQYGVWVTDFNGQCTDGRIMNCDVNTTLDKGFFIERAAGFYIAFNHLYSIKGSGYVLDKCFATFFIGNQIADFGNDATITGTFSGIGITCIEGYPTVVADNIIVNHEANAASSYTSLSITMDGFLTATYGTYCTIHDNQIRGAYPTVVSVLSLGLSISATSQQQTSGQPAGILMHGNHYDRVHTAESIGSYIQANWSTYRVYGPSQLDGDLSFGAHIKSTSAGGMTITAGASAGTTPPAPRIVQGHDARGDVGFGTGTTPSSGVMIHVAFNKAFGQIPCVLICPVGDATAALQLNVGTVSVNGFDVRAAVAPAASQANTVYEFTWWAVE